MSLKDAISEYFTGITAEFHVSWNFVRELETSSWQKHVQVLYLAEIWLWLCLDWFTLIGKTLGYYMFLTESRWDSENWK